MPFIFPRRRNSESKSDETSSSSPQQQEKNAQQQAEKTLPRRRWQWQPRKKKEKKQYPIFHVGDHVLVTKTQMDFINMWDNTGSFTVSPVNVHGYPKGEGRTEEEQQGPYDFVLAAVATADYDEKKDKWYYTVLRTDTHTYQFVKTGWMEPITNSHAIEAAWRASAAQMTETELEPPPPRRRRSSSSTTAAAEQYKFMSVSLRSCWLYGSSYSRLSKRALIDDEDESLYTKEDITKEGIIVIEALS